MEYLIANYLDSGWIFKIHMNKNLTCTKIRTENKSYYNKIENKIETNWGIVSHILLMNYLSQNTAVPLHGPNQIFAYESCGQGSFVS